VNLPLLLSQRKYRWSLAAVEANVDSATHLMVGKCVAGGKPRLNLSQYIYEVVVSFVGEKMV